MRIARAAFAQSTAYQLVVRGFAFPGQERAAGRTGVDRHPCGWRRAEPKSAEFRLERPSSPRRSHGVMQTKGRRVFPPLCSQEWSVPGSVRPVGSAKFRVRRRVPTAVSASYGYDSQPPGANQIARRDASTQKAKPPTAVFQRSHPLSSRPQPQSPGSSSSTAAPSHQHSTASPLGAPQRTPHPGARREASDFSLPRHAQRQCQTWPSESPRRGGTWRG